MGTGRIDSFYNIPELQKEQAAVKAMLDRTIELIAKVQGGIQKVSTLKPGGGNGAGAAAKKETDALTRANEALKQSLQATNLELQKVRTQTQINNTESRQQAKALGLVGGAYDKLSGQLEIARKNYRNLAAEEKHLSDEGLNLAKNIAAMDAKIKAIDASMGNHQRNVGNYKSAFNGLNVSVSQLAREMPAFSVSMNTGILAISNNIPMLQDEIKGLIDKNKQLRAEGKPTESILKQLGSAVFSWNTAISLAVTLFTVYGKQIADWAKNLFLGAEATDRAKQSQEILNETLSHGHSEYVEASKLVIDLKEKVELAKEGFISKEKTLKLYNETLGKTTGKVGSLDEAEQALVKNGEAYIKMTLYKAAANIAQEKAANKALEAALKGQQEAKEFLTTGDKLKAFATSNSSAAPGFTLSSNPQQDRANAEKIAKQQGEARKTAAINQSKKDEEVFKQIGIDFLRKAAQIAKDFKFDFFGGTDGDNQKTIERAKSFEEERLKAIAEGNKVELQIEADTQQRIATDAKQSLENRILALYKYQQAKDAILQIDSDQELQSLVAQRKAINDDYDKRVSDAKGNSSEISQINKQREIEITSFDSFASEERKKIAANLKKERIDLARETGDAMLKIEHEFNKDLGDIYKDSEKTFKESIDQKVKAFIEANEKMQKDAEKRQKALQDLDKETNAAVASGLKDVRASIEQGAQATLTFIQGINDAAFDRRKNQLQDEIDLITDKEAKEIEAIKNSTLSEQQKADKIAILQASNAAQKEQLELKQRRLDQRRAQFEKSLAITQIILNTSLAIMKAYTEGDPYTAGIRAGVAAAIGALQLAVAVATPIPKFATGTKNSPEGVAWVGEKGTEGRINPDGSFELTPNKPTLTYLKKGTEIIPNHELMAMLPQIAMSQQSNRPMTEEAYAAMMIQKLSAEIVNGLQDVKTEIRNKKETHFSFGPDGFKAAVKQGASWYEYLNRGWND